MPRILRRPPTDFELIRALLYRRGIPFTTVDDSDKGEIEIWVSASEGGSCANFLFERFGTLKGCSGFES